MSSVPVVLVLALALFFSLAILRTALLRLSTKLFILLGSVHEAFVSLSLLSLLCSRYGAPLKPPDEAKESPILHRRENIKPLRKPTISEAKHETTTAIVNVSAE